MIDYLVRSMRASEVLGDRMSECLMNLRTKGDINCDEYNSYHRIGAVVSWRTSDLAA